MKKMKKMLALALAFVLAVTILPMVGRKEAKAASIPGYYRMWFIKDTVSGSPTKDKRISQWESIGNPAVDGIKNLMPGTISYIGKGDYVDSAGNKLSSFVVPAKGVEGESETEYKYTDIYSLDTNGMKFTAPCDGTVEIYCVPNKNSGLKETGAEITVSVNGKAFEEKMVVPEVTEAGLYVYEKEKNYVYTWEVSSGEEYTVAASHRSGLMQLNFIPATKSVVSTIGAAYREENGEYGNGVRFGSELDKKSANYANITESGTLIAIQDVVGAGTTLTLETEKCKPVKRTTVYSEDDNKLQYTVVVTNIPEEKKGSVLVARPYVKMNDDTVVYGEQISGSWNSIQEALAGTK